MNNRQRGNAYEREVEKILQEQGYTTHRAYAATITTAGRPFSRSNDIFTVADIIAKSKDKATKWIQVTTGPRRAEKQRKLQQCGDIWNDRDSLELWLRYEGGLFKIYQYQAGEFIETGEYKRGKFYDIRGGGDARLMHSNEPAR